MGKLSNEFKDTNVKRKKKGKKTTLKGLSSRLSKVEKEQLQVEKKYTQVALASHGRVSFDFPTLWFLSDLGQGITNQMRIGRDVHVESILLRFQLKVSIDYNQSSVRMIFGKIKNMNGVQPTLAMMLDNNGAGYSLFSPYDKDGIRNFKIIKDELYSLVASSTSSQIDIEYYWKNPNHSEKTTYDSDDTSPDITDCVDNHYFVFFLSDQSQAGLDTNPTVRGFARLNYTDQ